MGRIKLRFKRTSIKYTDFVLLQFALLRHVGGETTVETVKAVLNRLLTNYTMLYISLDGRSYGKMAFRNTPVCRIVVG